MLMGRQRTRIRWTIGLLVASVLALPLLWVVQMISEISWRPGSLFVFGLQRFDCVDGHPSFSPDGSKILYQATRMGDDRAKICVMNVDGSRRRTLARLYEARPAPSYSPDGSQVIFTFSHTDKDVIAVMNARGRRRRSLLERNYKQELGSPSYSPDGSKIVFSLEGNIHIMDRDGRGVEKLTGFDRVEAWSPRFSPDGSSIVFAVYDSVTEQQEQEDVKSGLWVMDRDGSNLQHIAGTRDGDIDPSYSPDGTKIVFCSDDWSEISVIDSDGGNQQRVTRNSFYT